MTNSLIPVLGELEKAYKIIESQAMGNLWGFQYDEVAQAYSTNPKCPAYGWDPRGKTIITIQNPGRRKENSWFKGSVWESDSANIINALAGDGDESEKFDEITIADHMLSKPVEEILYEIAHQTIHAVAKGQWPQTLGANGYHPLGFKRRAGHWFDISESKSKGWSIAVPRDELKEFVKNDVIPNIDTSVFDLMHDKSMVKAPVGSNLKKWSCECTNLRVSTWMKGKCTLCGTEYRYTDKDADSVQVKDWLADNEARWSEAQGGTV